MLHPFENIITKIVAISWENLDSINFTEYAMTQLPDGVRCHILCNMNGIFALFNKINNSPDSRLRLSESVIYIGRKMGVSGYIFEAVHSIRDGIFYCFDIVLIASHRPELLSENLLERVALLKQLVGIIGIRELACTPHLDLSTFATSPSDPFSSTADIMFTKLIRKVGCEPISMKWRCKVTMNFTLSYPVTFDEYDLFTSITFYDAEKSYDDDFGRLLLPYGVPSRIKLTGFQIPRLSRRNVVELSLTGSHWTFVRHRPDLEHADSLSHVLASLDLVKKSMLLTDIMQRAGFGYLPTVRKVESSKQDAPSQNVGAIVVGCALLRMLPEYLFLCMAGSCLTILDIKRLSTTSLSLWQSCDHIRLAAPSLCFELLSKPVRNKYFLMGSLCLALDRIARIVRGKCSLDAVSVAEIRAAVYTGLTNMNGISLFCREKLQPLMHLCSLRTRREFSLLLFKSSSFLTFITEKFRFEGALLSNVLSDLD